MTDFNWGYIKGIEWAREQLYNMTEKQFVDEEYDLAFDAKRQKIIAEDIPNAKYSVIAAICNERVQKFVLISGARSWTEAESLCEMFNKDNTGRDVHYFYVENDLTDNKIL